MTAHSRGSPPPSFWQTVRLLLGVACRRAVGRSKRQRTLLFQRTGKEAAVDALGWFGFVAVLLVMALLNFGAAYIVELAVGAGQRLETEKQGKIVVGRKFLDALYARDGAVSNAAKEQT